MGATVAIEILSAYFFRELCETVAHACPPQVLLALGRLERCPLPALAAGAVASVRSASAQSAGDANGGSAPSTPAQAPSCLLEDALIASGVASGLKIPGSTAPQGTSGSGRRSESTGKRRKRKKRRSGGGGALSGEQQGGEVEASPQAQDSQGAQGAAAAGAHGAGDARRRKKRKSGSARSPFTVPADSGGTWAGEAQAAPALDPDDYGLPDDDSEADAAWADARAADISAGTLGVAAGSVPCPDGASAAPPPDRPGREASLRLLLSGDGEQGQTAVALATLRVLQVGGPRPSAPLPLFPTHCDNALHAQPMSLSPFLCPQRPRACRGGRSTP